MYLKTIGYLVAALLLCTSCGNGNNKNKVNIPGGDAPEIPAGETMTGNDKDEHGCIASAGYTWCSVQERCIRLWEEGIRLSAVGAGHTAGAEFNTYLVFAADSLKAELFDVKRRTPVILQRKAGKSFWSDADLSVEKVSGKWIVRKGDDIINIEIK